MCVPHELFVPARRLMRRRQIMDFFQPYFTNGLWYYAQDRLGPKVTKEAGIARGPRSDVNARASQKFQMEILVSNGIPLDD
jgi:hypothetical protein